MRAFRWSILSMWTGRRLFLVSFFFLLALAACRKEDSGIRSHPSPPPASDTPYVGETPENPDLSVLDLPLKDVQVLTSGTWLRNNSVMQCFALPGDGTMYAVQVAASSSGDNYKLNLVHKGVNSNTNKQYMQLAYFGHGSNIVYEKGPWGEEWIWVGNYGTNTAKDGTLHYTSNQTVARICFEADKELSPEDVTEQWYLPGVHNIHPAIDFERKQIAFWSLNQDNSASYFHVYDLDEVLAIPKKQVTLTYPILRGVAGEATRSYSPTVHNLADITPIATIVLNSSSWEGCEYNFGTGGIQGFELKGGRIYHYHGSGNDNTTDNITPVTSVVTVFDLDGHVVEQYRVMAVADPTALANAGITDTGFMESEGIKIYGDKLYLGYATRKSTDNRRYVTILSYPLKSKGENQ